MKIFISYRFTGENLTKVEKFLTSIKSVLEKKGNNVFCSYWKEEFFQKEKMSYEKRLDYLLGELNKSELCLLFIRSSRKSEGMLIEAGYAIAKGIPLILVIKDGIKTVFLEDIAKYVIKFKTISDLKIQLEKIKL